MSAEYDEIQSKRQALKDNIEKALPSASFQKQGAFTVEEFDEIKKGYDIMTSNELQAFVDDFNGLVRAGKVSNEDYKSTSDQINSFQKATVTDGRNAAEFFVKKKLKEASDELEKAGGEGSKGGKVIGHTASGKPIYENMHGSHPNYGNFSVKDHKEASVLHSNLSIEKYKQAYDKKNPEIDEEKRQESIKQGGISSSHDKEAKKKDGGRDKQLKSDVKEHMPQLHKWTKAATEDSDAHTFYDGASKEDMKDMEASYKKHKDQFPTPGASETSVGKDYHDLRKKEPGMAKFHKHIGHDSFGDE